MKSLLPLVLALWLAGCKPPERRADLVFINGAEPETLDPSIITGQPEGRIVNALFEGLTAFDAHGRSGPGVAESWTISPDRKVYTFKLRPDAKWSDGQPVTAGDFVASWKRTLSPDTAAAYKNQLFYIKNAEAFAEGKEKDFGKVGVRALDDRTLEVTLENPTSFFLDLCATPPLEPVPVKTIERYGDDWVKPGRMVNNGAYVLDQWRLNDKIRLRKNPYYWDAKNVAMEVVDALPISSATVAFNFYASGVADLIIDKNLTPGGLLEDLKQTPQFHAAPFLAVYFLDFNCRKPPFNDPRVRKAFAMSIDKRRIVDKITRAGEPPATGFVPPGIPGYQSPPGLPYDPAGAARLLAEAGFPEGKNFPLTSYLYNESEQNKSIAVELQDMWRRDLGVDVTLARQEWKVYLNSLSSLDYDIGRASWVGDYPDPNTFLDMFVTGNGNNRTGFSDPQYDALIAEAARESDPQRRFHILAQAEHMLVSEQAVVCPIYFYVGIQLFDPKKFGGIYPNLLDEHPIRKMYRVK